MKIWFQSIVGLLFVAIYALSIGIFPNPEIKFQQNHSSVFKKSNSLFHSKSHSTDQVTNFASIPFLIDASGTGGQNSFSHAIALCSSFNLQQTNTAVRSKFKQYLHSWLQQLIVFREIGKLFPFHSFW